MLDLHSVYHALPHPLRGLAASVHGYRLRWWRYGIRTDARVAEVLARDGWSNLRWESYSQERLASLLHRAATSVPYYKAHWAERRRRGDTASWEYLENWPVVDKEAVRRAPEAFLADDCRPQRMYKEHTSGTSGKPLRLWWSRETVREYYALYEARIRLWNGVSRWNRWGILGGQLVVPFQQETPPYWVWNLGLNQLYLSVYHISAETAESYLNAIADYGCKYLITYPSAIAALARFAGEKGLQVPKLEVIITNAEPLLSTQRNVIESAFGCSVRDTYGMAEIVSMASECEAGTLHLWPDLGVTEVFTEDQIGSENNEVGKLVCTGLLNQDMPLIRYDVGDHGKIFTSDRPCDCGRNLPVLAAVEGRNDDLVITQDGRRIGRLDPVFKGDLPIREAQIIQETIDRMRVRYVASGHLQSSHRQRIVSGLKQRVGDVEVILEEVDSIPRTRNGKLRAVISHVGSIHDKSQTVA